MFRVESIEKKIRKMILRACNELSFYEKESLNVDLVSEINNQYVQIALGINFLSIEAVVDTIKNIFMQIDLKYISKKKIAGFEIFVYYSPQEFPNRIIKFSVTTSSIAHCLKLTPKKLRALKPLTTSNADGVYCGWYFLKRFNDENDETWNIFQSHPHCILMKEKDKPDFLQVQGY